MPTTSAASIAMQLTCVSQKSVPCSGFFQPLPRRASKRVATSRSNGKFKVSASMKEEAVTGLTAAALTTNMMIPQVAEAAELTPSLKNFLLSILAGGVVLMVIVGAVIGVSNFDPVKRN